MELSPSPCFSSASTSCFWFYLTMKLWWRMLSIHGQPLPSLKTFNWVGLSTTKECVSPRKNCPEGIPKLIMRLKSRSSRVLTYATALNSRKETHTRTTYAWVRAGTEQPISSARLTSSYGNKKLCQFPARLTSRAKWPVLDFSSKTSATSTYRQRRSDSTFLERKMNRIIEMSYTW